MVAIPFLDVICSELKSRFSKEKRAHYELCALTDRFDKLVFRRPSIPADFLKRIVTSNFCDMKNLMSVVFGLLVLKMSFWVPKKGQLSFSERR